MTTNVQYLFEMDKLLVRPTPEQSKFELENYDFLKSVPSFVYEGFDLTRQEMANKEPLSMNFLWFANTMNGNVLASVGREYAECIKPTGRKNHCVTLPPNYECYIKKLTEGNLLPSYNHSDTSSAMCDMMALPEQNPLPVIFIGYTLSKTNDAVTGCYAVCIKGKDRLWVSDLTSLQRPGTGDGFNVTPEMPIITPAPQVKVRAKGINKAQ